MKVLVATHLTQGLAPGDYCWTVDGELVTPLGPECAAGESCGCERGFSGLASHRATTTAIVSDLPHIDRAALAVSVRDSLASQGWLALLDPGEDDALVSVNVDAILEVGATYPPGTIVRRTRDHVWSAGRLAA